MTIAKYLFFSAFLSATSLVFSKQIILLSEGAPIEEIYDFPPFNEIETIYDWGLKPKICETEDCHKVGKEISSSIDWSVDPCVDFYEFTCGRWDSAHPLVQNAIVSNRFHINHNIVFQRISGIFETDADASDILPVKMGKKWYRSCMDTKSLNARGIEPIESILMQVGGWPISMEENEWSVDDYSWQAIESYYARLMGRNVFYDVHIKLVPKNSKSGRIVLFPPEILEETRKPMLKNEKLYANFVTKVVKIFVSSNKAQVSDEVLSKQIQDLIQFERNIFKIITKGYSTALNWPANPMIFGKLVDWYGAWMKKKYPASKKLIDFETGIKQIFRPLNVNVDLSEPITISSLKYFERIGDLLERTPVRTIVNYVHWNFIVTMLKHTTGDMRDDIFAFESYAGHLGVKQRSPRWMECAEETEMRYATAYAFTKMYFPQSTESAAQEMIENIRRGLEANVENSDWLDENSKLLAKQKIRATSTFTGYPKWFRNDTAVTNYYKGLVIGHQYFDNVLSYMRFESKRKLMAPLISGDDEYDFLDRMTVNARHDGDRNSLDLPPVLFQPPLFTPGLPNNVNYGLAGFLVGHEFGHGFDDKRFNQLKLGGLGLSEKIERSYYQRARCFVDQYNKYSGVTKVPKVNGIKYDDLGNSFGSNSKTENIADSTGLQAVYQAYKSLMITKETNELQLPGVSEFTDDQLFFISFASSLCNRKSPHSGKIYAGMTYSPANLRVNGPVANTDDFAKVFHCPRGSPMNPIDKCSVWRKTSSESRVFIR